MGAQLGKRLAAMEAQAVMGVLAAMAAARAKGMVFHGGKGANGFVLFAPLLEIDTGGVMSRVRAGAGCAGNLKSSTKLAKFGVRGNGNFAVDDSGRGLKRVGANSIMRIPQVREKSDEIDYCKSRIEYLRNAAEGDGYALNKDSETDFRRFVRSASGLRRGSLVLMDNGNVRAIWKDGHGSRLGLQFLGGGMVQYAISRRREGGRQVSRAAGRDSFEGMFRKIDAFDLNSLVYE